MNHSKLLHGFIVLLFSVLLLFNTFFPYPTVNAENPTPTPTAPDYAEITADNAQYLQPQMTIGNGTGYLPRWSPDGKQLAVGGSKGVWLMDATALDQPPQLVPNTPPYINDLAFSLDGKLLASAGGDSYFTPNGYISVWDFANQRPRVMVNFPKLATNVAFSPNSKYLAYTSGATDSYPAEVEACIHILDISQEIPREVYTFDCQNNYGVRSFLLFSPDGNWLAFGSQIRDIRIVNLLSGKMTTSALLSVDNPRAASLASLTFSRDSQLLIINPSYFHVEPARIINLGAMQQINTWQDMKQVDSSHPIEGNLFYSDDGQKIYELLSRQTYSRLKIWHARSGLVLSTVDLPGFYEVEIQNPQNHTLILSQLGYTEESQEKDKPNFLVVDDRTGHILFGFNGFERTISLSPDGKRIALISDFFGVNIKILDATTGQQQPVPVFWTGRTGAIKFHPNGKFMSVNTESGIRFWDLRTYLPLYFNSHFGRAAISLNEQWLVTQRIQSSAVEIYDFQTHRLLHTITLPNSILHLAFTADSQTVLAIIATSYPSYTAFIARIDVESGEVTILPALNDPQPATQLSGVSEDGRLAIIYTSAGAVIWNIETNTTTLLQDTEPDPSRNKTLVAWTFNFAQSMVAAVETQTGRDGLAAELGFPLRVVLWNISSGELLQSMRANVTLRNNINDPLPPPIISFSPSNDRLFFRADEWQQPTAWDISTGKKLITYPLEARSFMSSPKQDILAAAVFDRLYVISATTPSIRWIWTYAAKTVVFSPDGKWLIGQNADDLTLFAVNKATVPTPQPPQLTPIASR